MKEFFLNCIKREHMLGLSGDKHFKKLTDSDKFTEFLTGSSKK